MKRRDLLLFFMILTWLGFPQIVPAIDFFFEPDTTSGDVETIVLVSGYISPSDSMRGFTVYMAYDTNLICLAEPVTPGTLIAGREGLEFDYFDHTLEPDVLEVGATVWSDDFWSGPGELFQLRFELKANGETSITAPYSPFFIDSEGQFPAVTFHDAVVFIGESRADDLFEKNPRNFGINAIYPNPFNSSATIRFTTTITSRVEICVYDILGRNIATLASSILNRGEHNLLWNADGLSSGTYLIILSTPQRNVTQKVILLR